jgi:hypothetical protein
MAAMAVQRGIRCWKARKRTRVIQDERAHEEKRQQAATRIQALTRGVKGRKRFAEHKKQVLEERGEVQAVTKIQAHIRRKQAAAKAEAIRTARLVALNKAATSIRKHWMLKIHRARYLQLREELAQHEGSVVTIQRYTRGFLVRFRMWRDAIRAEEELWASVEIQRVWRGYQGRLRWEMRYEAVWSRQVAVERLQRHIRGWLARTRAHRMRRREARKRFEEARKRFKAAQKIQALVRGRLTRRLMDRWRHKVVWAATTIQKVARGSQLRARLWLAMREKQIRKMQALGRGFLVRRRRLTVIALVILIQRAYRRWLKKHSPDDRQRRVAARGRLKVPLVAAEDDAAAIVPEAPV